MKAPHNSSQTKTQAFTIVELVVVVAVIAILAAVAIVGYGAWRAHVDETVLQSDLTGAAAAFENAANFNNTYPASINGLFTPSDNVTITGGALQGGKSFCLSASKEGKSAFITKRKSILPGPCPVLYFDPSDQNAFTGTSTGMNDLSGFNNDAIFNVGAVNNPAGKVVDSDAGGVLQFDGLNKYYTQNDISFGPNTTWTACTKTEESINTYNMFMGKYLPYFGAFNGTGIIFSNYIDNTQRSIDDSATEIPFNTWNCYAFTTSFDGSQTTMKIYVNAVERASGVFSGQQTNMPAYKFSVGDGWDQSMWYPYHGSVADVAIYNRTLTGQEITAIFEALRGKFKI